MDYEIVKVKEKMVAGITATTSNKDENMTQIIGGLWQSFFDPNIYTSISNKKNNYIIGLYSNYENGVNGSYDATVCCEVSTCDNLPHGVNVKTIPSGKYAKFVVHGHMQKAVSEFWEKLWSMDLDRKFSSDFEEYQNSDMENCDIHVYIALN